MSKRITHTAHKFDDEVGFDYRHVMKQLKEHRKEKHMIRAMKTRNVDELMDIIQYEEDYG